MNGKYMGENDIRRFNSFLVGAGYNISTLAAIMGMSRATLSSRINGHTDFTRREMEEIATLFGKDASEIFFTA